MSFLIWELIRAVGLTSFLLLFLSVAAGLLLSIKIANPKMNKILHIIHQVTGWISLLFGFFHSSLLFIDTYQPFTLMELYIPLPKE